jgi:hypothetical protein
VLDDPGIGRSELASKVGPLVAVARMVPALASPACWRARAANGFHWGLSLGSGVSDHVSDGRKPDSRVWAWALAVAVLVVALLVSLGAHWKQHAPQPLLEFIENAGRRAPTPK